MTHSDEITAQQLAIFSFLVDIKELLTHSISPIIIAGGLIFICDFFALKIDRVVQYHDATPLLVPCVGVITMGRGSWVMGQLCDGSRGSWVTKDDPFPSPISILRYLP